MYVGRRYYFITIAETRNITHAAKKLMVSQPSLTQYLNKLEADLDIKLVDRNFTPLRLTKAGKIYYDYLVKQRQADENLDFALRELKANDSRPLMIGIPLQKSHEIISKILPSFSQKYPSMAISIWEGTSSTVLELVKKGQLDIGFGHTIEENCEDCVSYNLNKEKLMLICGRDNPICDGRISTPDNTIFVPPELLKSQMFYQMSEEYYLYKVEMEHLKKHGIAPQRVTVMSNLHAIIASVIGSGADGYAYMPDYVMSELWPHSVMDQMGYFRLDDQDLEWNFAMFRRKESPLSRPARVFWDYTVNSFKSGENQK